MNLEHFTASRLEQNLAINEIGERVDSVRYEASVLTSRTIPSTVTTRPLAALQQEVATLRTALAISEACGIPNNNNPKPPGQGGGGRDGGRGGPGRNGGRGGPGRNGGRGGRGDRQPAGILGACSDKDKRLTRYDGGRTTKTYGNQNYCHTHRWDNQPNHDSTNCSYPDMHHDNTATAEDTKNGCDLYKRVSHKA